MLRTKLLPGSRHAARRFCMPYHLAPYHPVLPRPAVRRPGLRYHRLRYHRLRYGAPYCAELQDRGPRFNRLQSGRMLYEGLGFTEPWFKGRRRNVYSADGAEPV